MEAKSQLFIRQSWSYSRWLAISEGCSKEQWAPVINNFVIPLSRFKRLDFGV
jgi:hypothetical protein